MSGQADRVSLTKLAKPEIDLIVIHETNGRKYFEALSFLESQGAIRSIQFVEASVIWKFIHAIMRERKPFSQAFTQLCRNLRFRMTCWMLHDHVVLLGLAPWDFRLLLYSRLRSRNYFIYHTSWPTWEGLVPKSYKILTRWIRSGWLSRLRDPRVKVVAATSFSLESAMKCIGGSTHSRGSAICHVVSSVFFLRQAKQSCPLRLLYLGELSEKKGLPDLRRIMDELDGSPVVVDIVGDGPLRKLASELARRPGCVWHGHIRNREDLAKIVGNCHVLVAPVVRNGSWEELFGISIVEAMASGLPCIASDHIGPRSIITDGIDGIIVPERSPRIVAHHVRRLLDDPAAWQAMSTNAINTAAKYSLSSAAKQWETFIADHITDTQSQRTSRDAFKATRHQ